LPSSALPTPSTSPRRSSCLMPTARSRYPPTFNCRRAG
jgi:hypothetical protein